MPNIVTYSHFFDRVRTGSVPPRGSESVWGVTMDPFRFIRTTPINADSDGICASQIPAGAGALTLNGALVTTVDGAAVAILDYARAIVAASDDAGDTTQIVTVTGYDIYNQLMVETFALNGASSISGKKAFKKVTSVSISAATTGHVTVGTQNVFGLPFRVNSRDAMLVFFDTAFVTNGTFVAAVTTTATATTGDVRGTFTPSGSPDGSKHLSYWLWCEDPDTIEGFYGVAQYAG